MIEKLTHWLGRTEEHGQLVFPLFGRHDDVFEKVAAPSLLPAVERYIQELKPRRGSQYVLVNALGAGEYYGSNSNGDYFSEEALVHAPSSWTGTPVHDRTLARDWPWGYPTFYRSNAFVHHQNRNPDRAVGSVELTAWNPVMKRVELVVRLDHELCQKYGGTGVWDRILGGGFPDVSMGARVPFDLCSITLDREEYRRRVEQFKTERATGMNEGQWLAHWHKNELKAGRPGIRGLQPTREQYSHYCKFMMNKVFEDGRKVYVFNPHPNFFDISFVFIGADKTGKTMVYIARPDGTFVGPSITAQAATEHKDETEKTASAHQAKQAGVKRATLVKRVPATIVGSVLPSTAKAEKDLSPAGLDDLKDIPLGKLLSSLSGMGIVLKPREFQRVVVVRLGGPQMADDFEHRGELFGPTPPMSLGLSPFDFDQGVARLFDPFMPLRSAFGPFVEKRVVIQVTPSKSPLGDSKDKILQKVGAAYTGYRQELPSLAENFDKLAQNGGIHLKSLLGYDRDSLFTELSCEYLLRAHRE